MNIIENKLLSGGIEITEAKLRIEITETKLRILNLRNNKLYCLYSIESFIAKITKFFILNIYSRLHELKENYVRPIMVIIFLNSFL